MASPTFAKSGIVLFSKYGLLQANCIHYSVHNPIKSCSELVLARGINNNMCSHNREYCVSSSVPKTFLLFFINCFYYFGV